MTRCGGAAVLAAAAGRKAGISALVWPGGRVGRQQAVPCKLHAHSRQAAKHAALCCLLIARMPPLIGSPHSNSQISNLKFLVPGLCFLPGMHLNHYLRLYVLY